MQDQAASAPATQRRLAMDGKGPGPPKGRGPFGSHQSPKGRTPLLAQAEDLHAKTTQPGWPPWPHLPHLPNRHARLPGPLAKAEAEEAARQDAEVAIETKKSAEGAQIHGQNRRADSTRILAHLTTDGRSTHSTASCAPAPDGP